jgi:hypothetical protein
MSNVLGPYYSSYGRIGKTAEDVFEGVGSAGGQIGRTSPRVRAKGLQAAQLTVSPRWEKEHLALASGYRSFGGVAPSAEIATRRPLDGISRLARSIVLREVISYEWRGDYWLPRFQFEGSDLLVSEEAGILIAELSVALDDWELARWFVAPNAWLHHRTPLQTMREDFDHVHDAARFLRFGRGK